MKASEIIRKIQDMIDQHGDLEVGMHNNEYGIVNVIDNIVVSKRDLCCGAFTDAEELGDTYIVVYD